ncbi:hypothetical protein GGX14DRAFT_562639 [Mycena pura]|uniref:Uncharacterized protein n=1 Tax=Mycena pura TaxID=153505 RepID=A0AAD6YG64_9AGAR|nr:hypothetical protein GGX14DRAFT_562639 [Mycena pura]
MPRIDQPKRPAPAPQPTDRAEVKSDGARRTALPATSGDHLFAPLQIARCNAKLFASAIRSPLHRITAPSHAVVACCSWFDTFAQHSESTDYTRLVAASSGHTVAVADTTHTSYDDKLIVASRGRQTTSPSNRPIHPLRASSFHRRTRILNLCIRQTRAFFLAATFGCVVTLSDNVTAPATNIMFNLWLMMSPAVARLHLTARDSTYRSCASKDKRRKASAFPHFGIIFVSQVVGM